MGKGEGGTNVSCHLNVGHLSVLSQISGHLLVVS